jgi:hypothetical protein
MAKKWNKESVLRCVREDKLPAELDGIVKPKVDPRTVLSKLLGRNQTGV